jgi:cyclic-di-GMP phosphodiesterase TipF (flagellum assembly factor)
LAGLGFRFSLEAVTNLDMDLERLKENGFAFVKLYADVFLRGLPAVGAVIPSTDLCRHIADLGFGLIVDGISDEDSLKRLQRDGVLLGQGALLGGAKPVKAEILADLPQTHAA